MQTKSIRIRVSKDKVSFDKDDYCYWIEIDDPVQFIADIMEAAHED